MGVEKKKTQKGCRRTTKRSVIKREKEAAKYGEKKIGGVGKEGPEQQIQTGNRYRNNLLIEK